MIQVNSVSKKYPNGFIAITNFSYTFHDGQKYLIKGPSGAGKSTLLNIIGLLDRDYSGTVLIDNRDTFDLKEKEIALIRNKQFGFIFQEYALLEDKSVYDNIAIPLYYSNVKRKYYKEKINAVIKIVDLDTKINEKVKNLSGGQRQRVAIARALVNEPKFIIADEPFSSLDLELAENIFEILMKYIQDDRTLILVSHDIKNELYNDFIKVNINDGHLVE